MASSAFGQETHRVVDPADPPRDLSGWAWGVYVSLGLLALLGLLRLVAALGLRSTVTGGGDIVAKYDAYSRWVDLETVLFLIVAGVFIAWFFQAYKNLRRLGVQNLRWGNGWAIGSWFVPILSLVRPKQIANDIWRGSERGTAVSSGWHSAPVPALVHWWWGLFLLQGMLLYIGQQTIESGYHDLFSFATLDSGVSEIKTGAALDVIGELVSLVGIWMACVFVSQVTDRFDEIGGDAIAQASLQPPYAQPRYAQPTQALSAQPQSFPPPAPVPQAPTGELIRCPECAEWIQPQANVCRYCGYRLHPLGQ